MRGRPKIQLKSGGLVPLDAPAVLVIESEKVEQASEIGRRGGGAVLGRLGVPFNRLGEISFYTVSQEVHAGKVVLSRGITLFGRLSVPSDGCFLVLRCSSSSSV